MNNPRIFGREFPSRRRCKLKTTHPQYCATPPLLHNPLFTPLPLSQSTSPGRKERDSSWEKGQKEKRVGGKGGGESRGKVRRQQKLIRWISFGFCVFNHTPISFIKSSHQHFISRIPYLSLSLLLSLSLVQCLFCLALRRHFCIFCTVVFARLAFSFLSHSCLFVCCFPVHSLSRAISLSLHTPPPPSLPIFWPRQNFLQNEIVFVLTISLKLNYFYYSDRIRQTKGEKSQPPLPPPHPFQPFWPPILPTYCK